MKKIIIFGLNMFSEIMYYHLSKDEQYEVCAFTVDDEYCTCTTFMGKEVIPFSEVGKKFPPSECEVALTVGYKNMNELRRNKFIQLKEHGYNVLNYIHKSSACFHKHMGEGNIILENSTIGPYVEMGNGNIIYPSTTIAHHTIIGDFNFCSIECAIAGNVVIDNNCFFGANCTVRDNIKISDYTLVGAGAYISNNTEKYGAYAPERSIKLLKNSMDFNL